MSHVIEFHAALRPLLGPRASFKLSILFLILLYSNVALLYPALEAVRPVLAVAIAAILMMVIELAAARQRFRLTWPQGYLLIAFIGVAVISSFSAVYIRQALQTTSDIAKILLIYVLLENTVTSEGRLRMVLWTLTLGGLFPAIGTITNFLRGVLLEQNRAAWVGVFRNPNENAYAMILLIPLAAVLASTSRWSVRAALSGVIAAYLVAIYLTYSRGGLLGLLVVVGLMGWKQKSLVIRGFMGAALALGLAAVVLLWNREDDFKDLSSDTTVNQRIATIKAGMAMFADNPMWGVGPGCSLVAYPLYVPKEAHCGCQDQLVIHNAFIQVLSEMGLLGFIPFAGFIGLTMFQLRSIEKSGRSDGRITAYAGALNLALTGFVACGLSGGFAYSWFPYILTALAMAAKRVAESEAGESCRT